MSLNKILMLVLALFLASCHSQNKTVSAGSENNVISFKVNGEPVTTKGWNISRFMMGNGINLNITTDMHTEKRTIMMNLRGCGLGTYHLGGDAKDELSGYGDYKPDYSELLTSYKFEQGEFTITNIDTVQGVLDASFSGIVRRGDEVINITDGHIIRGALSKTVQTY